jgi:hypothetical protein
LSSLFGWVDPSPKAPQKMHLDIPKLLIQPKQNFHCLTRGVSHYGLAIYIKKHFKAKEELWKLKYFTMQKNNVQKIL